MFEAELDKFYLHKEGKSLIYFNQACVDYLTVLDLEECIATPARNFDEHLGRGEIRVFEPSPDFQVLLRTSLRGGFFSFFCKRCYYTKPTSDSTELRQVRELCALSYLKAKGISVPFPVAAVIKFSMGGFSYGGYLATRCIKGSDNLFILTKSGVDKELIYKACYQVGREALKMLEAGVFHPDLHLGNALWANDKAYLIDFDRASYFEQSYLVGDYKKKLLARWQRYSSKHGLADIVNEPFKRGLYNLD